MTPRRTDPSPSVAPSVDWKAAGLRRTPQREVVLGLVRRNFDHPTADWIHREARRVIPDISLATVYRTLRILRERGLIYEFSGVRGPSRYDGTSHSHEHVRCICCGTVADVDVPEFADVRRHVSDRTGFRIGVSPVLFQGLCPECAAKNADPETAGADPKGNGAAERPTRELDRDWVEGTW